jgi:RNA polymerase sigma-70 factor (ECF subfamily)
MNLKQQALQQAMFAEAHRDLKKKLSLHAFFKVRNSSMSEDLVQDTFIKTWEYIMRGGEIQTMRAFLYHVLNNLIVDQYRKHKTVSLDVLIEKGFEPSISDMEHTLNIGDGKVAVSLIKDLPVMYKKVIQMRFVEDLSLEEISNITGQSKNTVAVQIHRGLEKLKTLYNPDRLALDKEVVFGV